MTQAQWALLALKVALVLVVSGAVVFTLDYTRLCARHYTREDSEKNMS